MSDAVLALLILFGSPILMGVLFWLTRWLEVDAPNADELPIDPAPW